MSRRSRRRVSSSRDRSTDFDQEIFAGKSLFQYFGSLAATAGLSADTVAFKGSLDANFSSTEHYTAEKTLSLTTLCRVGSITGSSMARASRR